MKFTSRIFKRDLELTRRVKILRNNKQLTDLNETKKIWSSTFTSMTFLAKKRLILSFYSSQIGGQDLSCATN